jgi:hypothetical protein
MGTEYGTVHISHYSGLYASMIKMTRLIRNTAVPNKLPRNLILHYQQKT